MIHVHDNRNVLSWSTPFIHQVATLQAIEERSKREAEEDDGPDAKKPMSKWVQGLYSLCRGTSYRKIL